jgi:hypothetical protein
VTYSWTEQEADWASVTALTAWKLNREWRDDLHYLRAKPALSVYSDQDQTIDPSGSSILNWNQFPLDTSGMKLRDDEAIPGLIPTSLLRIRRSGTYRLTATAEIAALSTSTPLLAIQLITFDPVAFTAIALVVEPNPGSSYASVLRLVTTWDFTEGDTFFASASGTVTSRLPWSPSLQAVLKGED